MISLSDVSFSYEGSAEKALDSVTLDVAAGRCVLVNGPSGCGKSTLLRVVNGLVPNYFPGSLEGFVEVDGTNPGVVPLYTQAGRTSTVFQNPQSQFYATDVESELAFSLENLGREPSEILQRVQRAEHGYGLEGLARRSLFALSGGQKQRVACACTDVADVPVVLLDEPTANLDYPSMLALAKTVHRWKRQGKTILIAEHRIAWILDEVDELVVMRAGRIAETVSSEEIRRLDDSLFEKRGLRSPHLANPCEVSVRGCHAACADGGPGLFFSGTCISRGRGEMPLKLPAFTIPQGCVTAFVGENGMGKTTLLRCLAGLERHDRSEVRIDGTEVPRRRRSEHVFVVNQDVSCQLFTQSVEDEISLSLSAASGRVDEVCKLAQRLDLSDVLDRDPFTLSGGQRQRVAIACALASCRKVLLFDEPTSGLDAFHMRGFAQLLRSIADTGRMVGVVTHDAELIELAADRIVALRASAFPQH